MDPEQRLTMINACFLLVHLTGAVRFLWIPVADVDITNVFDSHPLCPLQTEMESWARPKNVDISVGNWNCRNEFSAKPGCFFRDTVKERKVIVIEHVTYSTRSTYEYLKAYVEIVRL